MLLDVVAKETEEVPEIKEQVRPDNFSTFSIFFSFFIDIPLPLAK